MKTNFHLFIAAAGFISIIASTALASTAFEGRINAVLTYGDEATALLYTAETNSLRIELTATDRPNPVNLVDRKSGALTLVFPHNRSFVRLKPAAQNPASARPRLPVGLPPGVGPQSKAVASPGSPAMPVMSMTQMTSMAQEKMELRSTGQRTNILGLACVRYELKQLGDTLEVWATDQLLPYQPYVRNQMPGQGPRGIQELWPELLASRNLFPLRATLRNGNNREQFSFAVTSISPATFSDADASLFAPPSDYLEIQPLPF